MITMKKRARKRKKNAKLKLVKYLDSHANETNFQL